MMKLKKEIKSYKVICLVFLSTFLFSDKHNGQDSTDFSYYSMQSNESIKHQVLAKVGDLDITVEEFLYNYEFGPSFAKQKDNSKSEYLKFMIYEKLLALEGYSNGLDAESDVKLFLEDVTNDLATEQLYRDLIWNKIEISDEDINEALTKDNITLNLKWIYNPELNDIQNSYDLLKSGIPFDSVFNRQFIDDSVFYDDRILVTTRFKLEKTNPFLAGVIDSLKPGFFSQPITTPDGFYIVYLDNIWTNAILTETAANDKKYSLENALLKQKADAVSDSFINQLLFDAKPVIKRNSLKIIKAYIGQKYLSKEKITSWKLFEELGDNVINNGKLDISKSQNDILVQMPEKYISINHFLDWYSTLELYLKFNLTSPQTLHESTTQYLWRMVRDNLLKELAYKNNCQKNEDVSEQREWWKDKIVYSKSKQIIASEIQFDEDKLQSYYKENLDDYKSAEGKIQPFDEVRNEVRNDFYVYEYTKRIVNKVLTLKNKYKVEINEQVLKEIYVNDEFNPRAINLYTIKKGGTFIRPAYPTIDYEWQFWN